MKLMDIREAVDPASFFEAFYPRVYGFVAAATGAAHADVEDLVQETLLQAWRNRGQFLGGSSLLTWVLAVARNRVRMRLRGASREENRLRARRALEAIETELIPADLLETAELVSAVRTALEEIDAAYADLLVRRYFDGMSVRAIAEALGEGEKTVESRLHRAREAIRERLRRDERE